MAVVFVILVFAERCYRNLKPIKRMGNRYNLMQHTTIANCLWVRSQKGDVGCSSWTTPSVHGDSLVRFLAG